MIELTLTAGRIVKIAGIPFQLAEDTVVFGLQENLDMANRMEAEDMRRGEDELD